MTLVPVENVGQNPVEAAGRVFPPRRTIEVELTEAQAEAVRAHRRLKFAGGEAAELVFVDESHDSSALASMTVKQLQAYAEKRGIDVASASRKPALLDAIAAAEAGDDEPAPDDEPGEDSPG